LWLLASSFWSAMPDTTVNETLLVVAVITGGLWFGYALGLVEQVRSMFAAFQLLTLVSLFWGAFVDGGRGLGGWLGVFASRNTLTPVALFALLATLCWLYVERPRRSTTVAIAVTMVVVDLTVAVLAGAQTPFVAAIAAAVMVAVALAIDRVVAGHRIRRIAPYALAAAVLGLCGALVVGSSRSHAFDNLLSDRSVVWRHVIDASHDHWFEGFGYGAFWFDKSYLDPLYVETNLVFDNAHNSALEMLLSGGLVALSAILLVFLIAIARPFAVSLCEDRRVGLVWLAVASFCVFGNMTEAFIVYQSPFWMLVVAAAVAPRATRAMEPESPT
jgi:O-antigen ligase